jgi:nucleotide-binding universal stress UspA family protein
VLGSVADRVVRETPMPVVLIPPKARRRDRADVIHRVLVPLDGSPLGGRVVDHLLALRLGQAVTLLLLEVIQPGPRAVHDAAEARLARAARPLHAAGYVVEARVVVGGDVAPAIRGVAREEDADLIAMATHGRGGVRRMALGSVADDVVRGSDVPVLLVTPGDHADARDRDSPRPGAS